MDALSHALIAVILFGAIGSPAVVPFAVLGAVIIDADIFFAQVSDRDPRLYLLTHGGIAHSIPGAAFMSLLACAGIGVGAGAGVIPVAVLARAGAGGIAAVFAGAYLHLFIDYLACPGIPLIWPASEKKLTAGILPGPSLFLFAVSIFCLTFLALGAVSLSGITWLFLFALVIYLAVRVVMFLYVTLRYRTRARLIPTMHPLRWLVVDESPKEFLVRYLVLLKGLTGATTFEKFKRTDAADVRTYDRLPEVRRLKFHSYIVTAERNDSCLVLHDPLRENGYIPYPPKFRSVAIPVQDAA